MNIMSICELIPHDWTYNSITTYSPYIDSGVNTVSDRYIDWEIDLIHPIEPEYHG